jgi:hypothetical protein
VFMSQERDPRLAWVAISCTLELTSTSKLTEAEIARQIGVSELAEPPIRDINPRLAERQISRFLSFCQLQIA